MKKFIVTNREIWLQGVEVEAENSEAALTAVRNGGGTVIDLFEYSHQLPYEATVEEIVEKADHKVYLYTATIVSKTPLTDDQRNKLDEHFETLMPDRSSVDIKDDPEVANASRYDVEDWFK